MKQVTRSALLPYSAEQMFDVVNDVASYAMFLPWCSASEVLSQSETEMVARLTISRGSLSQQFTTRNELERPGVINLHLVDGPFTTLEGRWRFSSLGEDGCKIEMVLRFEMSSKMLGAILARVFEQATDSLVDAFCQRAAQIYPPAGSDDASR